MKKLIMAAALCVLTGSLLYADDAPPPPPPPANEGCPMMKRDNAPQNPPAMQNPRGPGMRQGKGMPGGEMKEGCPMMNMNRMGPENREGMDGEKCRQMMQNLRGGPGAEQEMMDRRMAETDPKAFEEIASLRRQVMEKTQKLMEKARKDEEDFRKLVEKYRDTKADADKAALKVKLEERAKNSLEAQKQRISDEEKNIQERVEKTLNEIASEKPPVNEKKDMQVERK